MSVFVQLLILAGAAAWVAYTVIERGSPKEYDKQQWAQRNGFLAISYGGLSRTAKGPHLSREEFRKHLEALEKNGFSSISTEDVAAFYRDGAPLPDRAVYIMFEGGRKDSAIFGQECLVQTGMRANMFVTTGLMSEWNRTFMKKAQIGTLGKSLFWNVGSSGHHIYAPGGKDSDKTYYLTDYLRDEAGNRVETLEKYRERAENDYRESAEILEKLTLKKPEAYLFTPSNTLNSSMNRELSAANRELLSKYFSLAFTREGIAYNSVQEDPYTLTRLRIPASTTPERLIELAEGWLPNFRPYRHSAGSQLNRWFTDHGTLEEARGLSLKSDVNLNGFAWLIGSDNWRNLTITTGIFLQPNTEHSLYLRYGGRESFVRVAIRPDLVRIQERIKGQGLSTLASVAIQEEGEAALEARLINNRLALFLNGEPLLSNPVPLQSESPGLLALGINPCGELDGYPNSEGETITASFGDMDASPLAERWKRVRTAQEVNAVISSSAADYSGVLVDVRTTEIDAELIAGLLRTADAGWRRLAILPVGSVDTDVLDRDIPGLPAGFSRGLWSGVVLLPGKGKSVGSLSEDILRLKDENLLVGMRLNAAQARAAAVPGAAELPVDFLLLPSGLDAEYVIGLKRRYAGLFFESGNNVLTKAQ